MKALIKHKLVFAKSLPYFKDNIEGCNALCNQVIKFINFSEGSFFTLLPEEGLLENLYEFETGPILPQFPEEERIINGRRSTFSYIPDIEEEIADYILKALEKMNKTYCIFDDVSSTFQKQNYEEDLFKLAGFYQGEDVYYIIKKDLKLNDNLFEFLKRCIRLSKAFWHSLCILTKADLSKLPSKELSLEVMEQIAIHATQIMVGAYDGEGFVFWERNKDA